MAIDHRGHGRGLRTLQRFRLEDAADDAAALCELLGLKDVILVGYSMGGPIALLKDGDVITIDATRGEISVALSDAELEARRRAWPGPRPTIYGSGALWKYAQLVGPTRLGAVTHPGAEGEKHVYADL